ncbi:MAG: CPBP family intramembrane metalloprotease, partial [Firmicutes bacterium]|nr:CPBP family intramembrane metalloprotease [Bacillota bacterium]
MESTKERKKIWIILSLPGLWLLCFVLMILGQNLGSLLYLIPGVESMSDASQTAFFYVLFIGIWILVLFHMFILKKNRPIFKALWTESPGNNIKMFLIGFFFFGMFLNALCAFAALLNKDIFLSFYCFEPLPLLWILFCVFVQSSAEELLCRGFLYQRLRRSYKSPWVAIIGNSVFFGILHLLNPGVTVLAIINIIAVGILYSFMVYYGNSIWCAMAAHTAWNFTQNIIFGLPNSGSVVPYSIFMLDAGNARDSLVYNVGFGVEGTVFADILLIVSCIGLYFWYKK